MEQLLFNKQQVWSWLEEVCDPEVPVLTILDLGVVRDVKVESNGKVVISITPTYTGCPAMDTIKDDIFTVLSAKGINPDDILVNLVLSPAWSTDWLSESGKQKLFEYGIAPPVEPTHSTSDLFGTSPKVRCPNCKSQETHLVSLFGSTACKALYKCDNCQEPFDYFKCLK